MWLRITSPSGRVGRHERDHDIGLERQRFDEVLRAAVGWRARSRRRSASAGATRSARRGSPGWAPRRSGHGRPPRMRRSPPTVRTCSTRSSSSREQDCGALGLDRLAGDAGEHLSCLDDGACARSLLQQAADRGRSAQVPATLVAGPRLLDRRMRHALRRPWRAARRRSRSLSGAGSSSTTTPITLGAVPSGTASRDCTSKLLDPQLPINGSSTPLTTTGSPESKATCGGGQRRLAHCVPVGDLTRAVRVA